MMQILCLARVNSSIILIYIPKCPAAQSKARPTRYFILRLVLKIVGILDGESGEKTATIATISLIISKMFW